MISKKILAIALLIGVSSFQLSAQVKFHTGGTKELYVKAKESDKLVFVDLYASWCPPCKMMESKVFSREDVGKFMAKGFVSAKYSVDEGVGKELSRQYNVSSIPTYLIFTPGGELIGRVSGGMSAEEFMSNMQRALDSAKKTKW